MVGSEGTTNTAGDDTIVGTWTESGAGGGTLGGTLNLGDNLNAGAGTNTLQVTTANTTAAGAVTTTLTGFTASNVQKVFVKATGSTAANTTTYDASTTTAATEFWSDGSTRKVIFGPAGAAGTAIQQNATIGLKNTLQDVDATFKDTIVQGTSDTGTVALGGGVGDDTTQPTVALHGATGANGFETINVVSSGTAANRLADLQSGTGNDVIQKVNISGSSSVRFDSINSTELDTINASGLTGTAAANVDATNSTQTDLKFTGSANGDRLVLNNGVAAAANTFSLNGGDGTDTIADDTETDFANAAAAQTALRSTINKATSFEVLEATAADVTTLAANQFTSIKDFKFSGANTDANLALTGVATANTFTFANDFDGADGANGGSGTGAAGGTALTFTGADPGETASIVLSSATGVDIIGGVGGDGASSNAGGAAGAAINFGGAVSTLTIESTGKAANFIRGGQGGDGGASNSAEVGGNAAVAIDNGTSVQAITITGDKDLTIAGGAAGTAGSAGAAGLASLNAFTNSVNVNAGTFSGKLVIAGSTQADTFTVGTGGSTLNATEGADKYTLGTGKDTLVYTNIDHSLTADADDTAILNSIDKISSWGSTDKLDVDAVTGTTGTGFATTEYVAQNVVQAAVNAVGPTTLKQAAEAAAANLGADKIGAFQYGGNTYVLGQDGNAGFTGANDLFIQITGEQTLTVDNFILQ